MNHALHHVDALVSAECDPAVCTNGKCKATGVCIEDRYPGDAEEPAPLRWCTPDADAGCTRPGCGTCPLDAPTSLAAVVKDSNPKDAIGIAKAYASTVPRPVVWEVGVAMLEGALKYGRHNYRAIGVRASVYYDAVGRHLDAWWEGEDTDPDSGLSHITKAIAGLVVLRDAMLQGKCEDDRPPPSEAGWLVELNARAAALLDRYPAEGRKEPFTTKRRA